MRGRLVSVRIRGYRCLEDLTLELSSSLTLLVGANGSGKSSVLDALQFVSDLLQDPATAWSGELRGVLGSRSMPYRALAWKGGPISFDLSFETGARSYRYVLELAVDAPTERPLITKEHLFDDTGNLLLERDDRGARVYLEDGTTIPVGAGFLQPALSEGLKENSPFSRIVSPATFLAGITLLCPVPPLMRGGQVDAERPDRYGRDFKWRLHRLLTEADNASPFHDALNRHLSWRRVKTPLRDGHLQVQINEADNGLVFPIDTASDGSIVYTYLAALANHPPSGVSVLLLDEPATGLFRRASQLAAELLDELSLSMQLVLTTQSTGLMDELEPLAKTFALRRIPGQGTTRTNVSDLEGYEEILAEGELSDVVMSWADYPRNEERLATEAEE